MSLNHPLYEKLRARRFVLASTLPRRKEILKQMGITDFEVISSDFAEDLDKANYTADEYVTETAKQKGLSVLKQISDRPRLEDYIVLSADTIVVSNGKIFEKPTSKENQLSSLKYIRDGKYPIQVKTSVHIWSRGSHFSHLETTDLVMDYERVDDSFLQFYVDSMEAISAAGGFKIQGLGGLLFNRIDGDYNNVVGLPFTSTWRLLEKAV